MGGNNHGYSDGFILGFKTVKKLGWLMNTLDLVEKVFISILETFIAHSCYNLNKTQGEKSKIQQRINYLSLVEYKDKIKLNFS